MLAKTSDGEKHACAALKALGYNYVNQFPIDTGRRRYFADIYIPALRLVLEIDGGYHHTAKQKRLDSNRSQGIRRLGYHVCRLTNAEARSVEKVRAKIKSMEARCARQSVAKGSLASMPLAHLQRARRRNQ